MYICTTVLVVITASFLKPLLGANQSLQLPIEASYDQFTNIPPFENDGDDDDSSIFLTLRLPHLLTNIKDTDFEFKRQFDPWGGKRLPNLQTKDENFGRKRQFSPWGGKRSSLKSPVSPEEDVIDANNELRDLYLLESKKNFNSWGGKRNFNSWGGKRNSNSWDSKRSSHLREGKEFNSWSKKHNFNSWGGKRSGNYLDKIELSFVPKKNEIIGSKRQGFNSWGGKRNFNSWGGKRGFNSWAGKRSIDSDSTELTIPEDISTIPRTFKKIINDIETNMR